MPTMNPGCDDSMFYLYLLCFARTERISLLRYEKLNPTPAWLSKARSKRRKHESDDEEPLGDVLTSTASLLSHARPASLPSGDLAITRLRDANISQPSSGHSLHSVAFHPSRAVPVLMTSSSDRRVRLYTVDGHSNPHLQTLHIPDLPQPHALFSPDGSNAYLFGMAPHFWTYDLQAGGTVYKSHSLAHAGVKSTLIHAVSGGMMAFAGANGVVALVDARAKQSVGSLKANGGVADIQFTGTGGNEVTALGLDSEVYVFDVRARRCVKRWRDVDGFAGSTLGASAGGKYLATGYVPLSLATFLSYAEPLLAKVEHGLCERVRLKLEQQQRRKTTASESAPTSNDARIEVTLQPGRTDPRHVVLSEEGPVEARAFSSYLLFLPSYLLLLPSSLSSLLLPCSLSFLPSSLSSFLLPSYLLPSPRLTLVHLRYTSRH